MKEFCKEALLDGVEESSTELRSYLKKLSCKNIKVIVTRDKVEVVEEVGHVEIIG